MSSRNTSTAVRINRATIEPWGKCGRHMVMKRSALIVHLATLVVLFTTLAQPYAVEKPAGVRRAIETVANKDKYQVLAAANIAEF